MKKVIKNCIKCNFCGDIIVSDNRHDYKGCACGAVAVDGGRRICVEVLKIQLMTIPR